jgi:hypothetical protein
MAYRGSGRSRRVPLYANWRPARDAEQSTVCARQQGSVAVFRQRVHELRPRGVSQREAFELRSRTAWMKAGYAAVGRDPEFAIARFHDCVNVDVRSPILPCVGFESLAVETRQPLVGADPQKPSRVRVQRVHVIVDKAIRCGIMPQQQGLGSGRQAEEPQSSQSFGPPGYTGETFYQGGGGWRTVPRADAWGCGQCGTSPSNTRGRE